MKIETTCFKSITFSLLKPHKGGEKQTTKKKATRHEERQVTSSLREALKQNETQEIK